MSKAQPPHRQQDATQKTQEERGALTKYSTAGKRNADDEHAGVAIAVHKKWVHLVEEVREISGRTITVLIRTGSGGIAFIATYAPTADKADNIKNKYWEELALEMEANKAHIRMVAGDFNARLYEVQPDEKEYIGKGILERPSYLTRGIAEDTKDNRNRFVDFLKTQEMVAINTTFHKPAYKRVTYKEKVPAHNPTREEYQGENTGPYDHTKYAQCDFWLVEKTHRGMLKDCEAKMEWARDSDHYPVWVKIQLNKKKKEKENHKKEGMKRYWKPTEQQWVEYNRHIWESLVSQHKEEWEAIKHYNNTHEPDSPFTLALTQEEER